MIVLRLFRAIGVFRAKIIYYCHFPDMLLTDRRSFAKSVYRYVIDSVEGWSMEMADIICVNSQFTKQVVENTFRLFNKKLYVVYPTLNTQFFDRSISAPIAEIPDVAKHVFISINRFERKKNIGLALEAFAELKSRLSPEAYKECFFVIAGGYDKNNEENLLYYRDLREYAVDLQISTKQILFLRSPSDDTKVELLRRAIAVLYTPSREHFGIVPVEAMYMKCCVIAVDSGGPKESVVDGVTGFLVQPQSSAFAEKMASLVTGEKSALEMGNAGYQRVLEIFSMDIFRVRLAEVMKYALEK